MARSEASEHGAGLTGRLVNIFVKKAEPKFSRPCALH